MVLAPISIIILFILIKIFIGIYSETQSSDFWSSAIIGLALLVAISVWVLFELKKDKYTDKIMLESSKFNKRFDVYSTDEVEARYLVTPLFMQLLYNLKTSFGVKNLKCSFYDDNLMIAISTNDDIFEIGDLFTSLYSSEFMLKFYREMISIYKMIEYFNLNLNTYLK